MTQIIPLLAAIREKLEPAFGPDTAFPGTDVNKSLSAGHCAVVASIVAKILGGELVSAIVFGQSHWFNRISVYEQLYDVDLTGDQFGFSPIQITAAGDMYPESRIRGMGDITAETCARAKLLAQRAGIDV